MLFSYSCFNCRDEKGLLNFVSERTSKTTIYRLHTFELKAISKVQLLFHWKSFENLWSFILYLEAGETEHINMCIVPFTIAKFSQKCLEAASTIKYEPLNSCITVHGIWIMKIFNVVLLNTCSHNKRRKKFWRIKMAVSKCPCSTFSNGMFK